jgi:hypothetical protein
MFSENELVGGKSEDSPKAVGPVLGSDEYRCQDSGAKGCEWT